MPQGTTETNLSLIVSYLDIKVGSLTLRYRLADTHIFVDSLFGVR